MAYEASSVTTVSTGVDISSQSALPAVDRIKALILERGLRPGDPMPTENELKSTLEISRSSVREAIRTLATLDIVDVKHGYGTFVGSFSLNHLTDGLAFRSLATSGQSVDSLQEVVLVRQTIDTGLAETVTATLQGTSNPQLRSLVAEMTALSERGESFATQDREFHTILLASLPRCELLGQLVESLWRVHTEVTPLLGVPQPREIHRTVAAHGAMLNAAEAGDTAAYRQAVADHYAPLHDVLAHYSPESR